LKKSWVLLVMVGGVEAGGWVAMFGMFEWSVSMEVLWSSVFDSCLQFES
jgi:hypothetical protein